MGRKNKDRFARMRYLAAEMAKEERKLAGNKSAQPQKTAKEQLRDFMAKQGYNPVEEVKTSYTRKDGASVDAERIKFSNGKTYMVTARRFWKETPRGV